MNSIPSENTSMCQSCGKVVHSLQNMGRNLDGSWNREYCTLFKETETK